MSSKFVRDTIKTEIATLLPGEVVLDLTGQFERLESFLGKNGVTHRDNWIGIQFIGSEELPISVVANNTSGKYREIGAIYLHVVEPIKSTAVDSILVRADSIISSFRGKRIGAIIIESITPPNFEAAATLQFEGGYTAASITMAYERDLDL